MTKEQVKNIITSVDLGWVPLDVFTDSLNAFLQGHFQTDDYNEINDILKSNPLKSYITGENFKDVDDIVLQLANQTSSVAKEDIPVSDTALKAAIYIETKAQGGDFFGELLNTMY